MTAASAAIFSKTQREREIPSGRADKRLVRGAKKKKKRTSKEAYSHQANICVQQASGNTAAKRDDELATTKNQGEGGKRKHKVEKDREKKETGHKGQAYSASARALKLVVVVGRLSASSSSIVTVVVSFVTVVCRRRSASRRTRTIVNISPAFLSISFSRGRIRSVQSVSSVRRGQLLLAWSLGGKIPIIKAKAKISLGHSVGRSIGRSVGRSRRFRTQDPFLSRLQFTVRRADTNVVFGFE